MTRWPAPPETHELKVLPCYFNAQLERRKQFELRKHDRDFCVGDEIKLNEIDQISMGDYQQTGRTAKLRITYILTDFEGIEDGYCLLGTEMINH